MSGGNGLPRPLHLHQSFRCVDLVLAKTARTLVHALERHTTDPKITHPDCAVIRLAITDMLSITIFNKVRLPVLDKVHLSSSTNIIDPNIRRAIWSDSPVVNEVVVLGVDKFAARVRFVVICAGNDSGAG